MFSNAGDGTDGAASAVSEGLPAEETFSDAGEGTDGATSAVSEGLPADERFSAAKASGVLALAQGAEAETDEAVGGAAERRSGLEADELEAHIAGLVVDSPGQGLRTRSGGFDFGSSSP